MLKLSNRLKTVLRSVPKESVVADIGTDHAFLPIALIAEGIAKRCIACDINTGPLQLARENVEKAGLSDKIEVRCSDGLNSVSCDEVDTVCIAGMGGDLICRIISETEWLKNPTKTLILQAMSSADVLRKYLYETGFKIKTETALFDAGRVYSVICAVYDGNPTPYTAGMLYVGGVAEENSEEAREYIKLQYLRVKECADNLKNIKKRADEYTHYAAAERELAELI